MDEARILLRAGQTTGAMYLAGYGIECILKALILSVIPGNEGETTLRTFRGHRGHDYEWLRSVYRRNRGPLPPREISRLFTFVDRWSTELRYTPGYVPEREAEQFMEAAHSILEWADGRL